MPTVSTLTVDVESKTSGFSTGLKTVLGGLGALAAGAGYAFHQFEESEQVSKQTGAVLKSTGEAANVTAKQVTDLASALSKKSGIDDEAIQSGENMILTFKNIQNEAGKGNDIFNQTTKAVLDMSVAMGQDMKSSSIQLGKALNDPIAGMSALSRVGVTFDEEQKKQIAQYVKHNNLLAAQKVILKEVSSEFGGSAVAQATASGKMQVALGNLAEAAGKLLAPAITFLLGKVTEWATFLTNNLGPILKQVVGWLKEHEGLIKAIAAVVAPVIAAYLAWSAATKVVAVAQTALNVIMAVNPWAVLALAIIAVAALIIHNWSSIKDFFVKVWNSIKNGAEAAWNFIKNIAITVFHAVVDVVKTEIAIVVGTFKTVEGAFKAAWDGLVGIVKTIWNAITNVIGNAIEGFKLLFTHPIDFFRNLWDKLKAIASNAGTLLLNAGRDLMVGLWNGIKSMFSTVWNGLTSWVSGLIDHIKGFLHIGSPSKVFEEIGVQMMAGMDQGIQKGSSDVRGTLAGFTPSLSGVGAMGSVSGDVILQIDGQTFARIQRDQLLKLGKRNVTAGIV